MPSPTPRPTTHWQQAYRMPFDTPTTTATLAAAAKIDNIKGRSVRIDRCWLSVPAGITANVSNFCVFQLLAGATVIASWSTSTAGQGTITANTPVEMVLSATLANRFIPDATALSLNIVVTGTLTVPVGRLVASGFEL